MSSIIITLIYFVFQSQILTAFGGRVNAETFYHSKQYLTFITIGIPFYMFGQAMNPVIRSDGSPQFAMFATIVGAIINIILDPIFIFAFEWGMMGAAVATVLGQVVTAILSIWYLCHIKSVTLCSNSFHLDFTIIKKFIPLGICSFLSQISSVASMLAINNMIKKYGALDPIFSQEQFAQIPMAVVGIVMKFFQIVISIVVGMAAGCIPIVGYNIGARRFDRAKLLFIYLLVCEGIVGVISLCIAEFLPGQLIALFGSANESIYYTEFAIKAFRVYLCMLVLACINKATFIYLQALGKALLSTVLSMVREVIFGVGFAIILPIFFGLDGVLYSMPVSDILTFIISVIAIVYTINSLNKENKKVEFHKKNVVE